MSRQRVEPELYTSAEVGAMFGLSPRTVQRLAAERRIGSMQITCGGRVLLRFRPEDVLAWADRNVRERTVVSDRER